MSHPSLNIYVQQHTNTLIGKNLKVEPLLSAPASGFKMPCSYSLTAVGKVALPRYLSEFRLRVSSF